MHAPLLDATRKVFLFILTQNHWITFSAKNFLAKCRKDR